VAPVGLADSRGDGRSLGFRVVQTLIALAVGIAVLEVAAHVWETQRTVLSADGAALPSHPGRLWHMSAGELRTRGVAATINHLGLRGPVPAMPRPPEQERILVVGDSHLFGFGLADDETFQVLLERRLSQAGIWVDVVNAAVPGYSTAQTKRLLDDVGWSLDPTLLIIGNLWSDVDRSPAPDEDLLHARRQARFNPLVYSAFIRWLVQGEEIRQFSGPTGMKGPHGPETKNMVHRVSPARYAALLNQMAQAATDRGVDTLLLLPCTRALAAGKSDPSGSTHMAAMERVAVTRDLPLIDLRSWFAPGPAGLDRIFVDHSHPSRLGNVRIATAVQEALTERGWPAASW
jgi:lysophospholipase L1-like esterase